MPAKRVGSASRADDEGRLLEPGSSREEEDSPRSSRSPTGNTDPTIIKTEGALEAATGATEALGLAETSSSAAAARGPSIATELIELEESALKPTRSRSGQTVDSQTTAASSGPRRSPGGAGRSPTRGQPRQKVVYYQNRFITIPINDGGKRGGSSGSQESGGLAQPGTRAHLGSQAQSGTQAQGQQQSANMELEGMPIDLDPITPAQPVPRLGARGLARTQSLFAKITTVLQDNRLKSGSSSTQEQIKEMNKNQEESHKVLKKILNIIFITTGVSLFLGVVVVIIYTSIGE